MTEELKNFYVDALINIKCSIQVTAKDEEDARDKVWDYVNDHIDLTGNLHIDDMDTDIYE